MSSPISPVLQQLNRLNRSSPDFHDQLSNILYGEEYTQCVRSLQNDDLVWLIEYLDKALDGLDPSGNASRKCLRELGSICGTRGILPTSYTLLPDFLSIDPDPFTRGGYGDVYQGTLNGSKVCIKRMQVYTGDDPQRAAKTFCQEAIIWKHLTHPNILPLLGVTVDGFQLVSNWMPGGHLLGYIQKNSDADRLELLFSVTKGLCYLHSCNVVHGDLKGLNILVDNSGHACIADFGLAMVTKTLDSKQSTMCQRGHSARWAAPEVLGEGTHSKEADMFSFAMVMIEVFTGAVPFSSETSAMAILATIQGRRPPQPTHPAFTKNLWMLMQRCWDHDPHLRPEVSEALQVLSLEVPAWKWLIGHTLTMPERISLIMTIFSDHNQVDMVRNLSGDNAQNVIDVINETLDSIEPQTHKRCLHFLYDICGRLALLPRSLAIPLCYNPMENPLCVDGFANVWKGQHCGQEVAVKVFGSHQEMTKKRFCEEVVAWKALCHLNVQPLIGVIITGDRLAMVSEWMENGNINQFVEVNSDADRLELLREVTRGLVYMHGQGVVHGGLKGVNILIDSDGHARLAGFSRLTMASDQLTTMFSFREGGTPQWMSPELFYPRKFGFKHSCPTKESDCYALGMVMYEVLSGQIPFATYRPSALIMKIMSGKRPGRPHGREGELFTDEIWGTLEHCWEHQPHDRINASAVLLHLERHPPLLRPPFNVDADAETGSDDQSDTNSAGSSIALGDNGLPLQMDNLRGGWLERTWEMFEVTTRKLQGL